LISTKSARRIALIGFFKRVVIEAMGAMRNDGSVAAKNEVARYDCGVDAPLFLMDESRESRSSSLVRRIPP